MEQVLLKRLLPERFSNKEEKTHNAIKSYLSSSYIPLQASMDAIYNYTDLSNTSESHLQPMFIYGRSGSGKSSFLAHIAAHFDTKADWSVLYHHTSSNNNVLSSLGRLGDKIITLHQNPAFFHKIGSWLKYKKAFDSEQNVAKQRKILATAMRKVTTHFTKALHDFGGKNNDQECEGEYLDSIYDSIAVMGSSRTLEEQTNIRKESITSGGNGNHRKSRKNSLVRDKGARNVSLSVDTDSMTLDSSQNTSTTNTTLSAKTLSDHEMYQRAMSEASNTEFRSSFHIEDRPRQLLILIDDLDTLSFGDVDKEAVPYKLDFPAIVSLIARSILPTNIKIICSVSEDVIDQNMSTTAINLQDRGRGFSRTDSIRPQLYQALQANINNENSNTSNNNLGNMSKWTVTTNPTTDSSSNEGTTEKDSDNDEKSANNDDPTKANGTYDEMEANEFNENEQKILNKRDINYLVKRNKYVSQLKGNTFGSTSSGLQHKKYFRIVESPCPVFKIPDLLWAEATEIAKLRAKLAGGKTLSNYFLEKLRMNENHKNALFVKIIVEELINFGNYDIMNNYIDIISQSQTLTELMMIHIKYLYNYYEKIMPGLFYKVIEYLWQGPGHGVMARQLMEDLTDLLITPTSNITREELESKIGVLMRTTTVIEYSSSGYYRIVDFTREAVEIFLNTFSSKYMTL